METIAATQQQPIVSIRVKLLRQGDCAYAIVTTATGEYTERLEPGMTAGGSLRKSAADLRIKAERLLRRATILECAEGIL